MRPYLQKLDFTYYGGELFWDRSGELAQVMRSLVEELQVTKSGADQRDLRSDLAQVDLFYGITAAGITSTRPGDDGFVALATKFLGNLARIFEVKTIRELTFRYVMAQRCETQEEAVSLFGQLCGPELSTAKDWIGWGNDLRARQYEYELGEALQGLLRFAVVDSFSEPGVSTPASPHVLALCELRLPYPTPVLGLDTAAFMDNFIHIFTNRVKSRLNPPPHESATPGS